jgi:hypothetical protein
MSIDFDNLSRALAAAPSRRRALAVIGGSVMAAGAALFSRATPADAITCPGGQIVCNGHCVDTTTDPSHCGGCGTMCLPGQVCISGVCANAPDFSLFFENSITTQPTLSNNDGATWVALGTVSVSVTSQNSSVAHCSGSASLFTSVAGDNQDIAIFIEGGTFGFSPGTMVAWEESGGPAAFSPNAAFVRGTVTGLVADTTYVFRLRWKTNKPQSGTIYAGAGTGPAYSPTGIQVNLITL